MAIDVTRRDVLNPAVPPLAKVVQDSSQVRTTSAAAGASMPLSGVEPEDKPTFVPDARDPVAYSRADCSSRC